MTLNPVTEVVLASPEAALLHFSRKLEFETGVRHQSERTVVVFFLYPVPERT